MDTLEHVLAAAKYQTILKQQKDQLQASMLDACVMAHRGGLFELTPEFLAGLSIRMTHSASNELRVLDSNQNPILVNVSEFLPRAVEQYNQAVTKFGELWSEMKKQRSSNGILSV
jgi:hypothetical protein